jgi:hypothetical protein
MQQITEKHDISTVWTLIVSRKLLEHMVREMEERAFPGYLENENDAIVDAAFLDCVAVSQERVRPMIPAMLARYESTKTRRFSAQKREELQQIADKLLSPAAAERFLAEAKKPNPSTDVFAL